MKNSEVEVVSGGLNLFENPVVARFNSTDENSTDGCRPIEGKNPTPGAAFAMTFFTTFVSAVNLGAGALVGGTLAYMTAARAEGTTCPSSGTPLTREQYNEIIDRGLRTGGPL